MTLLEKLDLILQKCNESPFARYEITDATIDQLVNPNPNNDPFRARIISFNEIFISLDKLLKDKYLDCTDIFDQEQNRDIRFYKITFEGRVFIEQGGYTTQNKLLDEQRIKNELREKAIEVNEEIQRVSAKRMVILTTILAGGTIIAALYYLIKGFLWFFCY